MNVEEAEQRLRNYLLDGLATAIFWADQACALAEEIGRHAEQVNAVNFGELFGSLQLLLSERHTLAIAKIFDPVRRYPTPSIPGTLALLEKHAELWSMHERQKLQQVLIEGGSHYSVIDDMSDAELTRAVVSRFRDTLPDPNRVGRDSLSLSLGVLQQSRDKAIAHNEAIERTALGVSTWGEANS